MRLKTLIILVGIVLLVLVVRALNRKPVKSDPPFGSSFGMTAPSTGISLARANAEANKAPNYLGFLPDELFAHANPTYGKAIGEAVLGNFVDALRGLGKSKTAEERKASLADVATFWPEKNYDPDRYRERFGTALTA